MMTRAEQIEFLNQPKNLKKFKGTSAASVEDYFADYYEEYERDNGRPGDALFQCVLADLNIPYPKQPGLRTDHGKLQRIAAIVQNYGRSWRGREREMLDEIERILAEPEDKPAVVSGKARRAGIGEEV